MQFKKFLIIAALLASASLTVTAETTTAKFEVRLTVESICNLTADSSSNINLGNASDGSVNNNISLACSNRTPYKIGFLAKNDGAINIIDKLNKDSGRMIPWGNTADPNTTNDTGTGLATAIFYPIYTTTTGSANIVPDSYFDIVDVTVTH